MKLSDTWTVHFRQTTEGKKPKRRRTVIAARLHRGPCMPDGQTCASFSSAGKAVLNPMDPIDPFVGQSLALARAMQAAGLPRAERQTLAAALKEQAAPAFHLVVQLKQGRRVLDSYARSLRASHAALARNVFAESARVLRASVKVGVPNLDDGGNTNE